MCYNKIYETIQKEDDVMGDAVQHKVAEHKTQLFLMVILFTNLITMLNTSTVTISLPTYMKIFQVDINTVQWVVVGYMLPLGMMMPLAGYLCERYSYRKIFLGGLAAMGLCSLGCACAWNFYALVAFRFLKGVAGGIIVPSTIAMLYRYIAKGKQAAYLGTAMLFQAIGVTIGPTLAGLLLEVSSWHVLFLFNVPLVALALWAGWQSIPSEAGSSTEKVDIAGILQISIGTGMIMIAFTEGDAWGWTSALFWGCLLIGSGLAVLFIIRQFHTSHPLLNFAVLRYKPFVLAMLVQCTLAMTLGINAILSQFYFQTGLGWTPAATGLFLLGPAITQLFGNRIAIFLHNRGFMRSLITGGMLVILVGNLGLCNLSMESNLVFVMICFAMRYSGIAVLSMPLTNYGIGSVPPELSGHASSMYNWSKQVVQVVSTNILTVLLSLNLNRYYLAAGNTGIPQEGTMAYRLAAIEAVNTDYLYLAVALVISLGCTLLIKPQKK